MDHNSIGIILIESPLNDQCDYHAKDRGDHKVDERSNQLLNFLMNFPSEPSVLSVELFILPIIIYEKQESTTCVMCDVLKTL